MVEHEDVFDRQEEEQDSHDRVPLAGFEQYYEITKSGIVYDKQLGEYLKDTFNPFSGGTYITVHVDGKKHDLSHWQAIYDSFMSEQDKKEFDAVVAGLPAYILEDKHNIKYKSPRYLLPYTEKYDLPLYVLQAYLRSKATNIKKISIEDERRFRYLEVGQKDLEYILTYDCGKFKIKFSTAEVAELLGLGTIRQANKLLLEYGLQKKEGSTYVGTLDRSCWGSVGRYSKLVWYFPGVKAIYDAAVEHGQIEGDDPQFVALIRQKTDIFEFDLSPAPQKI